MKKHSFPVPLFACGVGGLVLGIAIGGVAATGWTAAAQRPAGSVTGIGGVFFKAKDPQIGYTNIKTQYAFAKAVDPRRQNALHTLVPRVD